MSDGIFKQQEQRQRAKLRERQREVADALAAETLENEQEQAQQARRRPVARSKLSDDELLKDRLQEAVASAERISDQPDVDEAAVAQVIAEVAGAVHVPKFGADMEIEQRDLAELHMEGLQKAVDLMMESGGQDRAAEVQSSGVMQQEGARVVDNPDAQRGRLEDAVGEEEILPTGLAALMAGMAAKTYGIADESS